MRNLQKYYGHIFDDYGGTTSPDYKEFESKYIRYLKRLCKKNEWTFIQANKNHYLFSAVILRNDGQHVYISISDVRYFRNSWHNNILVRTMAHAKDWHGGANYHYSLDELENGIAKVR